MKAALLSFHNAYNYGAALQAYALQCAVEKLGAECEYLNYQNAYRKHAYDMKYQFVQAVAHKKPIGAAKALIGMPVMTRRGKKFEAFYKKYLHVTDRVYATSEEAGKTNDLYDKFIVGSDQVWNYSNNGGDTAYLLDFVRDDSKKISYSSSFGVSSIPPEWADVYASLLGRFSRLSSRESIGTEIIENITGRKSHPVLDPVFLAGKEEWEKIREKTTGHKPYIFFYTNRQSQIKDFLNTGYDGNQEFHVLSTHVSPKELLNSRMKLRIAMSPEEFLEEINSADLVVTASFHCLALAIIYHKQFSVLLTGDYGKDERIANLLKITGLEDRIITSTTVKEDVEKKIDYAAVDHRLESYLNASREYLRRAIFDEQDIPFDTFGRNKLFCMDSRCTGCGACEAVCPRQAIRMEKDAEGFTIPVLDEAKCIHCYKCHSVCQIYSRNEKAGNQRYYAAKNSDEIRRISSSGGVFSAMTDMVFSENGIVCAAGMDGNFRVRHMFASNPEEMQPMRGTYYVQSDLGDAYRRVKEYLDQGKKLLFVGTPCQVGGLKLYIGKAHNNLLTCDIVCHGVPSPLAFEKFVDYLRTRGELTEFNFRDKRFGWKGYHVSAVIDGKSVKDKLWLQAFNNLFSHNMINRLSCGSCPYTNYNRPGDITIGDFWGIEKSRKEFMDSLGVSLVITNTVKGDQVFNSMGIEKQIEVRKVETEQHSLLGPASISMRRLQVFQTLRTRGMEAVIKEYGEANAKGYCKNIVRKMITKT